MRPDVVIAGGGPAGAAAAIRLAHAGARVVLIERTRTAHDKVCGEFLSAQAMSELAALGLDTSSLGAQPIARVAIVHGRRSVDAELLFPAQALSRGVLDEALLNRAAAAGVDLRRGVIARPEVLARERGAMFVATGKHDLRGHARAATGFLGFKLHLRLSAAARAELGRRIALIPLAGGYCGLQPLSDGVATLCLALTPKALSAAGGTWPALVDAMRRAQPQLDGWLAGSEPIQHRPLAVGRIPYGYVRRTADRAYWLGDQAAVIPSFTGAGIGLALVSGRMAADAFLRGEPASRFQERYAALTLPQIRWARLLSSLLMSPLWSAGASAVLSRTPALLGTMARMLHAPDDKPPEPHRYPSWEAYGRRS